MAWPPLFAEIEDKFPQAKAGSSTYDQSACEKILQSRLKREPATGRLRRLIALIKAIRGNGERRLSGMSAVSTPKLCDDFIRLAGVFQLPSNRTPCWALTYQLALFNGNGYWGRSWIKRTMVEVGFSSLGISVPVNSSESQLQS